MGRRSVEPARGECASHAYGSARQTKHDAVDPGAEVTRRSSSATAVMKSRIVAGASSYKGALSSRIGGPSGRVRKAMLCAMKRRAPASMAASIKIWVPFVRSRLVAKESALTFFGRSRAGSAVI
jgi:hypothetical protein